MFSIVKKISLIIFEKIIDDENCRTNGKANFFNYKYLKSKKVTILSKKTKTREIEQFTHASL